MIRARIVLILVLAVAGLAAWLVPLPDATRDMRVAFGIFIFAVGLWITEAVPIWATGVGVIFLSAVLLGAMGEGVSGSAGLELYLRPCSSPVLALFFGGLIISIAAAKHGLDARLARVVVGVFGTRPSALLVGLVLTTGGLSMFISNTAAAAMMLALLAPLRPLLAERPAELKMMTLGVALAAGVGGMATIVGSPPNAVAARALAQSGAPISFVGWMAFGLPLALTLLAVVIAVLLAIHRPSRAAILLPTRPLPPPTRLHLVTLFTLLVTVGLWLTEPWHGVPSAAVALLPPAALSVAGAIDRLDLRAVEWSVLGMVAGGLTLGEALERTGLARTLVTAAGLELYPPGLISASAIILCVLLSNVCSNTATASILIPMVASIPSLSVRAAAPVIALATALALSLPISTPPLALAYASEVVTTRDILKAGSAVSLIGITIILAALAVLGW